MVVATAERKVQNTEAKVSTEDIKSLADVEPEVAEFTIAPGTYLVKVNPDVTTKAGDAGHYVEYGVTVLAPTDLKGRKVNFQRLFTNRAKADGSPSKALGQTVGMLDGMIGKDARREITGSPGTMALATNIARAIKGATFVASVGIEKGKDGYADRNRVRGAKAASEWAQEPSEGGDLPF